MEEARKERAELVETINELRRELKEERSQRKVEQTLVKSQTADIMEYASKVKRDVEVLNGQLSKV